MALTLPKLSLPKLSVDKKKLPTIVGGVIVLAAAGWFGWQYFMEEPPPPPPPKRQAVKAVKPKPKPAPVDPAKVRDKLIADVMTATGMEQQVSQLPQRLIAGIRESGAQTKKASPAMLTAIEDAVAESFTADGFKLQVDADLKKNFDEKRMRALLKDYSTPAAKAMVKLERGAPSGEEGAKVERGAAAKPLAPKRAELLGRIDAATRASDLAVEMAFVTMKALGQGAAGEGARKAASVEKAIEKQRDATTRKIREATLHNLAISFKDASDADLEKYAAIHETENSKWFYGLVYAALLEEAQKASAAAGARVAELAPKPAPKPMVSKAHGDARRCLELATNTAIIKCAEKYR